MEKIPYNPAIGISLKKFFICIDFKINLVFQAQFCIAFLHSMQLLFYDCGYPRWSMFFTLPNAIFFYYLFSDFYNKAYIGSDNKKIAENGSVKQITNNDNEKPKEEKVNGIQNSQKMNGYSNILNENPVESDKKLS